MLLYRSIKKPKVIFYVKSFTPANINQASLDVTNIHRKSTVIHRENTTAIKNLIYLLF